jgi:D-beta-D-heptose 7-phosphate kinase/D-beta-D-heptose 1-phosphate adenosyltransferase
MTQSLPNFSTARVLVVGDVMLDRYWHGDTRRISPEAPVPVVQVERVEARPGGAANVAVNVAALGATVTLVGLVGDDEPAQALRDALDGTGVRDQLAVFAEHPTICKMRVMSRHQQLLRLDVERPWNDARHHGAIETQVRKSLPHHDVLVLSDYAKGALGDVQSLIALARDANVPVIVDPKGIDFDRYRGATALTPNLSEFEAICGRLVGDDAIGEGANKLRQHLALQWLLVTRGEDGMTLVDADGVVTHRHTEARQVYDVTGAGDTVVAVLGTAIAAGASVEHAATLANVAAGTVVSKAGTASVSAAELAEASAAGAAGEAGVLSIEQAIASVGRARSRGETVVFTNGCFDILHAGHVACIAAAKAFGDRLVVAINDDESVRRLKGEGRPINGVGARMAVLAALGDVDWVVSFSQDTPLDVIRALVPDVLVKGGDYTPDTVVGADEVLARGGTVELVDMVPGLSTTATIAAMKTRLSVEPRTVIQPRASTESRTSATPWASLESGPSTSDRSGGTSE